MTVELGFTIAFFSLSILGIVWKGSSKTQKLESKVENLEKNFEDYKEINSGIFKEIKEELKDLKNLMLDVIKSMPKRESEK